MNTLIRTFALRVLCAFAAFVSCSNLMSGGGSEITNGRVTGRLVDSAGAPVAHARVQLIHANYNPVTGNGRANAVSDTTGTDGRYEIVVTDSGLFNLQADDPQNKTMGLRTGITVVGDSVEGLVDTLLRPGSVRIAVTQAMDRDNGYVFIPGTRVYRNLSPDDAFVTLGPVPSGAIPAVFYGTKTNAAAPVKIAESVIVRPGDTAYVEYPGWRYSKKLYLNTAASGAGVAGTVTEFPVLVRLSAGTFNFAEAKSGGEDLRFAMADGSPLPYEIEQWDAPQARAAVWVRVDTVRGNDSTQYIVMHWGNTAAQSASAGSAVFDTGAGFQGVWHLAEEGNAVAEDATANHYNGTPSGMTAGSAVQGAIGTCRQFRGDSSCFIMTGTASGKLDFPKDGIYSISAWVYADTLDSGNHTIAAKGDLQYNLELYHTNEWMFTEYKNRAGWEVATSPAGGKTWSYVAGVQNGIKKYLFVNGVCTDSTTELVPELLGDSSARYTGDDFTVGRTTLFGNSTYYFSKGKIDEVRVSNVAYTADWIKLCAMNQRADDRLVEQR